MRLIDADALIDALLEEDFECHQFCWPYKTIIKAIDATPTVQPERQTGKWVRMSDADGEYYCCDQCGEELSRYITEMPTWNKPYPHKHSINLTNYCPNCGTEMRGNQNG